MPRTLRVPTVMVRFAVLAGIATLDTVLKALVPFTALVEFAEIIKFSVIVLPSTFVPVTVTVSGEPVVLAVGVTTKALGTSGSERPEVIVWAVAAPLVAPSTAVEVAAATSLRVSVYPNVLLYKAFCRSVPAEIRDAHG